MTLEEIFLDAAKNAATRIFINHEDARELIPYAPIPQEPIAEKGAGYIGRGGGYDWFNDPNLKRGEFRVS